MVKKARVGVEIEGMEELLAGLARLGVDVQARLEVAATAGGLVLAEAGNRLAPQPRLGVETSHWGQETREGHVTVDIGYPWQKWFWRFLELGATTHEMPKHGGMMAFPGDEGRDVVVPHVSHPGMVARPFLRPAFDQAQGEAVEAVGERLREAVEE